MEHVLHSGGPGMSLLALIWAYPVVFSLIVGLIVRQLISAKVWDRPNPDCTQGGPAKTLNGLRIVTEYSDGSCEVAGIHNNYIVSADRSRWARIY
jgi:hypothetical protein